MDMNEAESKALERGLNDATALSQDEWRGVALAMMAQCQPWYEELERMRDLVKAFEAFVHERRDTYEQMAQRDECDFPVDSRAYAAMQMAFNEAIVRGLELGLWGD